jgi:mRNA-degrading endonuclease RelE of RelBE toxin-antitoxin system
MYDIRWDQDAKEDMEKLKLRAHEVADLVDTVDDQLTHQPKRPSKRKKIIRPEEQLPFEHLEPVWQLRAGEFRIFYDLALPEPDEAEAFEGIVRIRAVRRKPPHKTTKEIL